MGKTIGVIGLGSIGMRHALNLQELGHRVIGFDPEADETHANEFEIVESVTDMRGTNAIVIASPTNQHAVEILERPNRPLFVEKPIGCCEVDRVHLGWMLHDYNPVMMVGYNLRFHACVKEAKRWIAEETPVWATFTCAQKNTKPAYLRDGVILNWSHEIDLALYLLGPAKVVGSSTRLTDGHDDITDILLEHDNGCRTHIHLDYVTAPEERHFTIQCNGVRLKADLVNNVLAEIPVNGTIDIQTYPNTFDDNYVEEMKAFIDRIDGKETIGCTGEEALKVLEICLKVREQAGLE